jgi:hypothetical protein
VRKGNSQVWMVGEISHEGDPVLIRHRLHNADAADPSHQWLAVVTHHLAKVQSNGLPEAAYNDSLRQLDELIIAALQVGDGDKVVLIETCHGKRQYYGYVQSIEIVGHAVQRVITENAEHKLSYRTALDPGRKFARRYVTLL